MPQIRNIGIANEKIYGEYDIYEIDFENEDLDFEFVEVSVQSTNEKIEEAKKRLQIISPAAVAIDTINNRILYEKNAFTNRQMASTTKMMTAILAIENTNLDDIVTISQKAANVGGSQAYLRAGEKIKMEHLLYGLMLPSGNDAGIAVAEHLAGNVDEFLKMMDKKALEIGAKDTKYGSPHGLDRKNSSTAYDLAIIASYCLKNPTFSTIVKSKTKLIPRQGIPEGTQYYNTNEMLDSYPNADGVKTGYTGPAGRCLVTSATRNDWQVVSVILGASSRNNRSNDSRQILDFVFDKYPLITVLEENQHILNIEVLKGVEDKVQLINKGQINAHINDDELINIKREYNIPDKLEAPIKENTLVGEVTFKLNETVLGTSQLYTKNKVEFWTINMNLEKIIKEWGRIGKTIAKKIKL